MNLSIHVEPPLVMSETMPELLEQSCERYGDLPALIYFPNESILSNPQTILYKEFLAMVQQAAKAFASAGMVQGDRVAIWAPNMPEWIVACLGAQFSGASIIPLNTRYKAAEVAYVLNVTKVRILVCIGEFLGQDYPALLTQENLPHVERIVVLGDYDQSVRPPLPWSVQSWQEFMEIGSNSEGVSLAQLRAALTGELYSDIMFTSGTTGKPKGVVTTHRQNIQAVAAWSELVGVSPKDRYLIVNPFFHAFGYKAGWLAALMRGATIIPLRVFDANVILHMIQLLRVQVLPGPPTLFYSLLDHPNRAHTDLTSLRVAVTGAATIAPSLIERMRQELGFKVVLTGYGLTESCGFATLCGPNDDATTVAHTCGKALPGIELVLMDNDLKPVAIGQAGEVCIRGYTVMQSYLDDPKATSNAIDSNGFLHTGDVGVLDEHGYLRITDRMKDMFICGGFNCYPAEIEKMMTQHPAIAQVAVVGWPDERMGEVGKAFVVLRSNTSLTEEALLSWCRQTMANYKVPRFIEFVKALPLNASGKVLKYQLRESHRVQ